MAVENYAELYAKAIAESGTGSEVLPDGPYNVKIGTVKPGAANNGKFRVGIRLEVLDGPHAGKSTWVNQTFSPENPKAVAVFLRILKQLGGQPVEAAIQAALPPQELVGYITVGATGKADLAHHTHGVNDDGTPDFPVDLAPQERSPVGYLYMAGTPRVISRGVTTVPLRHPNDPSIKADLAIVPNLGHDDVHF